MTDVPEAFADGDYQRAARAALAAVATEAPRSVEPLGRGNRKRTSLLRFAEREPVVLQLCDERSRLRTESALLAQVRDRTDVPVPPVLAADTTGDVAFMVTAYVPGHDLHESFTELDREAQKRVTSTFGAQLGRLHGAFRFDGYGPLALDDGELTAESADWDGWFAEYGRTAVETLPPAFDPIRPELQALLAAKPRDHSPRASLFPWDFRPGNALIADGQLSAVVDWEAPMAAPPALSAAKAEYLVARWYVDYPEPLRSAFIAGYESVREYPTIRPDHRVAAIADSAVDSTGAVTNPGYPELDREAAVAFHREALEELL